MSEREPATRYILTIEPKPGIDAIKALRWVLKQLLRRHGFRCTDLREEPTTPPNKERDQWTNPN